MTRSTRKLSARCLVVTTRAAILVVFLCSFGTSVAFARVNAYVTNASDNTVSVINTNTNKVIATIQVGTGPEQLAVMPNGEFVYVVCSGVAVLFR